MKINYNSDFKLTEKTEEGFAGIAFEFVYSTAGDATYKASCDGNSCVNCKRNEDGSVTVIFNHHGLGPGRLKVRREFFIPDADFADGVYNAVSNDVTDIMLVEGKTEGFDVEETFRPPYVVEGGGISVEIIDNLDSDASDKALSARQGKILNETKQPLLTGKEFKTINGESILGKGNIEIGGGEGGGIDSEPTNAVIEAIEPSLVSDALRKTAQVLTEEEKEQARKNIGAQKQLQLSVKDNGNIVLSNLDGETKEFMPATPSGDPMHWAYVGAGAEYNATTDSILKDAPWKNMVDTIEDKAKWGLDVVDASNVKQMAIGGVSYNYATENRTSPEGGTYLRYFLVGQGSNGVWVEDETKVLHLPKCWYLNGLGDITNVEMLRCYEESPKNVGNYVNQQFGRHSKARTLNAKASAYSVLTASYLFVINTNIEVPNIDWTVYDISNMFNRATKIRYSLNINSSNNTVINVSYCNTAARINGAFKDAISLRSCLLSGLVQSVSFSNCGNISKPSILHVITKASPTTAITITLHANAYARLANDADIVAALDTKNTALSGTGGSVSLVSA